MSHSDFDHKGEPQTPLLKELYKKAEQMTKDKENLIAAGDAHGEEVIREEVHNDFLIKQLPDDPLCLRISLGGRADIKLGSPENYLVFRGNAKLIYKLLRDAYKGFGKFYFK